MGGPFHCLKSTFPGLMPGWYFLTIYVHVNSHFGPSCNLSPSWSQSDHFGHSYGQFFIGNSGNSKLSEIPFFKHFWQNYDQKTKNLLFLLFSGLGIGLSFNLSHQTWRLKHFWQFYGVLKSHNWKKSQIRLRPYEQDWWKFKMSAIRTIFELYHSNLVCEPLSCILLRGKN